MIKKIVDSCCRQQFPEGLIEFLSSRLRLVRQVMLGKFSQASKASIFVILGILRSKSLPVTNHYPGLSATTTFTQDLDVSKLDISVENSFKINNLLGKKVPSQRSYSEYLYPRNVLAVLPQNLIIRLSLILSFLFTFSLFSHPCHLSKGSGGKNYPRSSSAVLWR